MTITDPFVQQSDAIEIIVSRIEKLWRKAKDPAATDAEREAFQAKALALMERHRIEEAALQLAGDDPIIDGEILVAEGRYAHQILDIVDAVSRAYNTRLYYYSRPYRKDVRALGFASDVDRVRHIARMLVNDALHQASLHREGSAALTSQWRRSFLVGYASAISKRFREAREMSQQSFDTETVKGAELVLVSRKEQVEQEYSKRKFNKGYTSKAAIGNGYTQGRDAGMRANTGNRQVSTRRELS